DHGVVLAETARVGESFPLDARGLSGRTAMEVFQALRPGQPVPAQLQADHARQLELRKHAPPAELSNTGISAVARTLSECKDFVFANFVAHFPQSASAGCGSLERRLVAQDGPGAPWTTPGELARVGICNNDTDTAGVGWEQYVWDGSTFN